MIAAQDVGFDTGYPITFWILLIIIIGAGVLIMVMANTMRDLQTENRRLLYNEQIYLNEVPNTEDVWLIENGMREESMESKPTEQETTRAFFDKHPGVTPKPGYERKP